MRNKTLIAVLFSFALAFLTTSALAQGPGGGEGGNSFSLRVEALEAQVAALQSQVDALLTEFNTHTANASAHHSRYTDAEASNAVGQHFSGDHADLSNVQPDQHHMDEGQAVADIEDLLMHFSRDGDDIFITGANLRVVNGLGQTDSSNSVGNVIIGYNEERDPFLFTNDRSGSHMLVVGSEHNYTSFGGIVVGLENTTSGAFASVSGGRLNTAIATAASVSGGFTNQASGAFSSVSGGNLNVASQNSASVSGGLRNRASGFFSSVSGGSVNRASGTQASVSGGDSNTASGAGASVIGGFGNLASNSRSSVSGGSQNKAIGNRASISGGELNTASGRDSSVSAGINNEASGENSSVSGGTSTTAVGTNAHPNTHN